MLLHLLPCLDLWATVSTFLRLGKIALRITIPHFSYSEWNMYIILLWFFYYRICMMLHNYKIINYNKVWYFIESVIDLY